MAGSAAAPYSAGMDEHLSNPECAAIWDLHLSAADLYRRGHALEARLIAEIADAAERVWLRRSEDNRTE
jgi:hypothetical protein